MKKLLTFVITTILVFGLLFALAMYSNDFSDIVGDIIWYLDMDQYALYILWMISAILASMIFTVCDIVCDICVDLWRLAKRVFFKIKKAA